MRTNMVALFGSAGFSVSVILVFWALIELMRIYLDQSVSTPARILFPFFVLIQPPYIGFIALDNVYLFYENKLATNADRRPTTWERILAIGPGYILPGIAVVVRVLMYAQGYE